MHSNDILWEGRQSPMSKEPLFFIGKRVAWYKERTGTHLVSGKNRPESLTIDSFTQFRLSLLERGGTVRLPILITREKPAASVFIDIGKGEGGRKGMKKPEVAKQDKGDHLWSLPA